MMEGYRLHLSDRSSTGYVGVALNQGRYQARQKSGGKCTNLGRYDTAVEAAVAYAKHVASAGGGDDDDEEGMADDYELLPSSKNSTGYLGVTLTAGRYQARHKSGGKKVNIGVYDTAVEAALAYARHVQSAGGDEEEESEEEVEAKEEMQPCQLREHCVKGYRHGGKGGPVSDQQTCVRLSHTDYYSSVYTRLRQASYLSSHDDLHTCPLFPHPRRSAPAALLRPLRSRPFALAPVPAPPRSQCKIRPPGPQQPSARNPPQKKQRLERGEEPRGGVPASLGSEQVLAVVAMSDDEEEGEDAWEPPTDVEVLPAGNVAVVVTESQCDR